MAEPKVPMDKKAFTQHKVRSTRDANIVEDVEAEMKKTGAVRKTAVDMAQNQSFFTRPMEYRPEIASPDRPLMPKDLRQQYAYWRLFYAMDPVAGSVVDMYVEMSLSDYQIVGKGVDGEIREVLEDMCDRLRLLHLYGSIMKEFMVIGEAVPHLFYNATDRVWDDWSMHKPEQVTVLDTQLFGIDPILFLEPSSEELAQLRKVVAVAEKISMTISGRGFLQNLIKMKKIPLEPLNVSFIPRLAHVYDVRGTSLFQRLWRTWMYEDAVMSATINTAKRHSCFKAGTQILTNMGIKAIETIKKGDVVMSGEGSFKRVLNAWKEETDTIVKIKAGGSELLECTPSHRFKVWVRPKTCACGCGATLNCKHRLFNGRHHCKLVKDAATGQFTHKSACASVVVSKTPRIVIPKNYDPIRTVNAEDIRKGDYLLIPRKFKPSNMVVGKREKLLARLLGYYIAEGHRIRLKRKGIPDKHGVGWTFSLGEYDTWAKDLVNIGKQLGVKITRHRHICTDGVREGRTNVASLLVANSWLADFCFRYAGVGASKKCLSEEVMRWPLVLKKELIKGWYRGDGSRATGSDPSTVSCGGASASIVYQMRVILAQLGIFGSVYKIKKVVEHWSQGWSLCSSGQGGRKLRKLVWGEDTYPDVVVGGGDAWWMDDTYIYVLVKSIECVHESVSVFNLTVDGDKSYIANGLQTFNSPVKTVSIGDIAAGIIGTDDQEKDLLRALAQSELDPHAWITVPPGTKYEAWGTTDKVMGIRNEYEIIERMKLTALGVSKDVISGSASFASAQAGLQVLLSRLLALRTFHDKIYVEPKVFGPIVKIHDWSVPTQAEVSHKVRTRSGDKARFVRPQIMWDKALKARADEDLLKVYKELKDTFDMKISQRTVAAAARVDWADEVRKTLEEEVLGAMIKNETSGMSTDSGGFDSGLNDTNTGGGDVEDLAPAPESTVEEGAPGEMHASSRSKMAGLLKELKKLGDAGSRTPKVYDTFLVGDMKQKVHNQQDVSEARLIKGSTGEQYNTKGGTGDGKGKEGK